MIIIKILKVTGGTIAIGALSIMAFVFVFNFLFFGNCSYQKQLSTYKNLSDKRLRVLYLQMSKVFKESNSYSISKEEADKSYPELVGFDFKSINVTYQSVLIGGCFDDKLVMRFGGLAKSKEKIESITISWGENPLQTEQLWSK
ncbi:hypothetical protein FLL45_22610 [Aliikangiella marina]|uniref:Uncharacterized protein n=1 Tax=Aliikangiella marina TaxID=1712262 RepID=A0A545T1Q1_9GAMM|nr:hypothetical protein [Aliikangiella marina]TQV71122.1 hypothetical protein FLL45_22610 [Aliikangiella marina]